MNTTRTLTNYAPRHYHKAHKERGLGWQLWALVAFVWFWLCLDALTTI